MVLANSEFRHELESDIEPFKGLLLGLFFITVGAGIRFDVLANDLDPEGNYKFNSADLFNIVQPTFGSVTANLSNGILTYTPAPNFNGDATVEYTITDADGWRDAARKLIAARPPRKKAPT